MSLLLVTETAEIFILGICVCSLLCMIVMMSFFFFLVLPHLSSPIPVPPSSSGNGYETSSSRAALVPERTRQPTPHEKELQLTIPKWVGLNGLALSLLGGGRSREQGNPNGQNHLPICQGCGNSAYVNGACINCNPQEATYTARVPRPEASERTIFFTPSKPEEEDARDVPRDAKEGGARDAKGGAMGGAREPKTTAPLNKLPQFTLTLTLTFTNPYPVLVKVLLQRTS